MLPLVDSAAPSLFEEHLEWAANGGRSVARGLPPSFDPDDLQQIAVIEHWRRVELYDGSTGVPYRAYAYLPIRGAVLMTCRRKHYREATHEELTPIAAPIDSKLRPDEAMLAHEEHIRMSGPRRYLQRLRVLMSLSCLPAEDAELVRQILAGAQGVELELAAPGAKRRLSSVVRKLRRELVVATGGA